MLQIGELDKYSTIQGSISLWKGFATKSDFEIRREIFELKKDTYIAFNKTFIFYCVNNIPITKQNSLITESITNIFHILILGKSYSLFFIPEYDSRFIEKIT